MNKRRLTLWLIIGLSLVSAYLALPGYQPVNLNIAGRQLNFTFERPPLEITLGRLRFSRDLEAKKGIDLAGGAHLVFEADMTDLPVEDRDASLESARENIERRINLFGVAEPLIQTSRVGESYRLIVELPGIDDVNQAISLVGQTAQLDFRELAPEATEAATMADFQPTDLTGADLKKAQLQFDPNTGNPVVSLLFNDTGKDRFAAITGRNVGRPVAIFLDEFPVTIPNVNEPITAGEAVITGSFTLDEAKQMIVQLNAGALPVPVKVIEQRQIGATLGAASVQKSLRAGLIGLVMVIVFMVGYYSYLGGLAALGLVIYGLLTLALYKLIPVTLTLPGIAGFLLSVGMAVDANILIFERMKEEIHAGRPRQIAMELGFGRAWDSIRDANVCTLITCFILFNPFNWNFLVSSGMVRGFALTLGLGVMLSLFTGVVVTRTILRTFTGRKSQITRFHARSGRT